MTPPRAITVRLAEPRDAQAIGMMSRDFVEAGLGWKYDAARVLRAIRDREPLAVVPCACFECCARPGRCPTPGARRAPKTPRELSQRRSAAAACAAHCSRGCPRRSR